MTSNGTIDPLPGTTGPLPVNTDPLPGTSDPLPETTDLFPGTTARLPRDGYDLEVYGLANGQFYYIHVTALCFIITSFCCVITVLVLSFTRQSIRNFFTWSKSERFVVYLAICDGLFNAAHSVDHLHMAITRNHVFPKELCKFYGFILAEFVTAQNLMVNIVAVNAFSLMYFQNNLNFGRYDWRLLAWTFGIPCVGSIIAEVYDQFGTNGSFCYFDGVKGGVANMIFTTVTLSVILVINIVLYILIWTKIHSESTRIRKNLGTKPASMRASHQAAKAMSLFVAAFFIQWWALCIFGVWALLAPVPTEWFYLLITFDNSGGMLNLAVYIIIRRKNLAQGEKGPASDNKGPNTTVSRLSEIRTESNDTITTENRDTPDKLT